MENFIVDFLKIAVSGPNLQELFERCGKRFSSHCVAMIALQLLDRFELLHSEQILYRDVKGENFLIGYPGSRSQNTIHVVDFGLAREWSPDQHERRSPAGTPRYMSLRTHMGKQPSYRDDLESLSFLFIYFATGKASPQRLTGIFKDVSRNSFGIYWSKKFTKILGTTASDRMK